MKGKILVANSNETEIIELCACLEGMFEVEKALTCNEFEMYINQCQMVVFDLNFKQTQSMEYIKNAVEESKLPALILGDDEGHKVAVEVFAAEGFCFVVKNEGYSQLLKYVVKDLIKTSVASDKEIEKKEQEIESKCSIIKSADCMVDRSVMEEVVQKLKVGNINLPVYPPVIKKCRRMVNQGASIDDIVELIQRDSAISSKIISVANSAYYNGMSLAKTLTQAVSRIGFLETRNYVEMIANKALYTCTNEKYSDYLEELWKHSLACAYISQELAKQLFIQNPTQLFAMGLFHDIGKLLLIQILSEFENREAYYKKVSQDDWLGLIQIHHCKFGESLMKKWRLPEEYSAVARWHEDPLSAENISQELLIVGLANMMAEEMRSGDTRVEVGSLESSIHARRLNLSKGQIDEVMTQVNELMAINLSI